MGGLAATGDMQILPIEAADGSRGMSCMWGMPDMPRSAEKGASGRLCMPGAEAGAQPGALTYRRSP
jgi:hypothetical protein